MTPHELALEMGISPKTIRQWLRDNRPHEPHTRWEIDGRTADELRARFSNR